MVRPRDAPKYWSAKCQRAVEGLEIRGTYKTPTKLSDLLGTYVLVYSGCPEFGGDVEDMYREKSQDDASFIEEYSITLDAKAAPGETVLPEAVSGCINWGTFKLPYKGLQRVRERWSKDESVAWMESYWDLVLVDEGRELGGNHWLKAEGNGLGVTKVVDDNGNPFLTFDWSLSGGGHSSWSGYYLGKKMVEGKKKSWRFTGEEQCRLGIGYTFRHVEKSVLGKCKTEYEEDEEEEHSDEEDSTDDDENDDSEDEDSGEDTGLDDDANGGRGEEALSKIKAPVTGGKRKARENDTGPNKRRYPYPYY